ncbi:ribosome hibernation-promoting factor, HPF/YfiA family [Chelativorans alearense]|uniref:ribosome hibernation-promoting factor, HPF/YfiA family n=1 Tax=Chelativorans alearense TaxID=2681495 RepID=UPI0013CFAD26|nr:ribosome-associated translation inhibitor RaiA [Chelativorans alearense]
MSLRISGKNMDIGDAFHSRIEERIGEAVDKYFDGGFSGRVTIEKSGAGFSADCTVHLDTGTVLQATGEAKDPQLAFDGAAERIEKRLRRYKRKLKSYSAAQSGDGMADMTYRVVAAVGEDEDELPEDYAPTVVAESRLPLKSMTVASAVIELDMKDSPVFVFRNAGSNEVNIVYRRADGNIGWIDPSAVSSA